MSDNIKYIQYMRNTLLIICLLVLATTKPSFGQSWNPGHSVGTIDGVYSYSPSQIPAQLVEIQPAAIPNTGLTYVWESSTTPEGTFSSVATTSAYTFILPLPQTTYFRRRTTHATLGTVVSNVIKISVVSINWEDRNYVREHVVHTTGITTWTAADQLPVGDKIQTTAYFDGLGRMVQKLGKEIATPAENSTVWGDAAQLFVYDAVGRQSVRYLPYTTTSFPGKYKEMAVSEQVQYYTNNYDEPSSVSTIGYDNSPLNRITHIKQPGTAWVNVDKSIQYELNDAADDVKMFGVDYTQGNPPLYYGQYPVSTLYKHVYKDENAKTVIQYTNKSGQVILKKVQVENTPSAAYTGWMCTYYIYDDLGKIRYELQPEAVKYLAANSWSFAGVNGTKVLSELCYLYDYDNKGRLIWKKPPGAAALRMLYDQRDRLVFTQDGNQAALSPAQWTATLYDELDRPVIGFLYNTTKTFTTLQTELDAATDAVTTLTISNASNTGTGSVTIATNYNSIAAIDLNTTATATVLKYFFYDNYDFPEVKTFNTGYTNTAAYSTSDADVMPIASTKRVTNMPTGTKTRVLGSSVFLAATQYYDERGDAIQTLEDNIKSGVDINTNQYHFDGRVLSTCSDHTNSGAGYSNFITLTKNNFDKIGRISSIEKQYGSNAFKTIAAYHYDDLGRIKRKKLSPDYANPLTGLDGMETLDYSYNIHNQVTAINKDYAIKSGTYNKWSHYFGMYLGYDNRDNVFLKPELNGQLTGVLWNSQGDDAQRKYDFMYDNAGRLFNAQFNERAFTTDSWSNAKMNFTVAGTTSSGITYDDNGNIKKMMHHGVMPGTNAPLVIDELAYTYDGYSNKLLSVDDNMTSATLNGKFNDFKDGSNGSAADYVYDNNGNVVVDLNKNVKNASAADGVLYNYLDKPETIRIEGKGTVKIVYSADGDKLQRAFIPEAGGSATITTYINEFIYQETSTSLTVTSLPPFAGTGLALSSINFEEGRIRVITPVSSSNGNDLLGIAGNIDLPNSKQGSFDYYIRDYQENVRMILTEETHSAYNTATMETDRASAETPVFGQPGSANEVTNTRFTTPTGWTNNTSGSVSRIGNLAASTIGPNTLQKVMAGDRISAQVSYYFAGAPGNSNTNMVSNVLGSLIASLSNGEAATSVVKAGSTGINSLLTASPDFAAIAAPTGSGGTTPEAYLTMLFFDERFNLVSVTDGGVVQAQVAATWSTATAPLVLANTRAPKNGYVYVYVSNRSDQHVYFDDFKVSVTAGNIIEENHYYAFGMKITAISSKKMGNANEGVLQNNYQYQGAFSEMDEDIAWNDFPLRNYDPQIAKFVQMDPFGQYASPYSGMGNDPVNLVDPSGGIGIPCPGTSSLGVFFMKAGELFGNIVSAMSSVSSSIVTISASAAQLSAKVYNTSVHLEIVSKQLAGNITEQAGQQPTPYNKNDGTLNLLTEQENKQIKNVLEFAQGRLNKKLNDLNRWDKTEQDNFKEHFGVNDNASKDLIRNRIVRELKQIKKYLTNDDYKKHVIRINSNIWARVNNRDKTHWLFLGNYFWKSNMLGIDSQHGTIIHELSHFWDIGATVDTDRKGNYIDNIQKVRELIKSDPLRALMNANAFEYYIED
ncbi:MAG: hypothetical protein KF746_11940 [Chitinophagaceae bacterium]|nr:hypothetical protein [Chitinophagaceae bacterium]